MTHWTLCERIFGRLIFTQGIILTPTAGTGEVTFPRVADPSDRSPVHDVVQVRILNQYGDAPWQNRHDLKLDITKVCSESKYIEPTTKVSAKTGNLDSPSRRYVNDANYH